VSLTLSSHIKCFSQKQLIWTTRSQGNGAHCCGSKYAAVIGPCRRSTRAQRVCSHSACVLSMPCAEYAFAAHALSMSARPGVCRAHSDCAPDSDPWHQEQRHVSCCCPVAGVARGWWMPSWACLLPSESACSIPPRWRWRRNESAAWVSSSCAVLARD